MWVHMIAFWLWANEEVSLLTSIFSLRFKAMSKLFKIQLLEVNSNNNITNKPSLYPWPGLGKYFTDSRAGYIHFYYTLDHIMM